jgi:predicted acetyltransferase
MTLELLFPRAALKMAYLAMVADYERAGEILWYFDAVHQNFDGYLIYLAEAAQGHNLPFGFVPYHNYWLVEDEKRVLGELRLRHILNAELEIEGGHIGYTISPSARRKGYGTLQLRLGLEKARALGLGRVLVTCDDDNTASWKIIEHNGGALSGRSISPESGKLVRQYWIELD